MYYIEANMGGEVRNIIALAMIVCGATGAFAQVPSAFGINMNAPLSSLKVMKPGPSKGSFLVAPPNPHAEFEEYMVLTSRTQGVCKILAIGRDHKNDRYGSDTQSAFHGLHEALVTKYGSAKDYDFLRSGALWKNSEEWVMAVRENERILVSFWSSENGSRISDLAITLEAKATSSDSSYVTLSYEFSNFKVCKQENEEGNNSAL